MENKNASFIVTIGILIAIVVALGGYIGYDKFLNQENTEKTPSNYVKTRVCVGTYSGQAALTQNYVTGEYGKGTLTIELNNDGTYKLTKENINYVTGEYTIIDNALLLKTEPDICGPGTDCTAQYSEYLNINDDCTNISQGYGPSFFDSDFTLKRQN